VWIKLDAQYYGSFCIVLVKSGKNLIYWNCFEKETLQNYLKVFSDLQRLNYQVLGVTSDWHSSIVNSVKDIFEGHIPHQRCLVHTSRRCRTLLTRKPKTEAGKQLREIVLELNKVRNDYEKNIWLLWLDRYGERWETYLNKRTYAKLNGGQTWWYTHGNVRKAFRVLEGSKTSLFKHLTYENLEKDTNGLESEFSHLKEKIGAHRGLKKERKISMIFCYVFFKNIERNSGQKPPRFVH
jgi:hypothetical protein